jgi:hypothetical protein
METKEELKNVVRDWIKLNNEMQTLSNELNKRKKQQKNISTILVETMKKHEIDCFDVKDGKIMYVKKNVKRAVTKKRLMEILSNFFEGDSLKASELNNYILDNREQVVKEEIKLKS